MVSGQILYMSYPPSSLSLSLPLSLPPPLSLPLSQVTCLQFSGNRIVSGSDDTTLKIWSAVNGRVSAVYCTVTCIVIFLYQSTVLWTTQSSPNNIAILFQCLKTLQGHTGGVWCSEFNGQVVVSGSTDRSLRVSTLSFINGLSHIDNYQLPFRYNFHSFSYINYLLFIFILSSSLFAF